MDDAMIDTFAPLHNALARGQQQNNAIANLKMRLEQQQYERQRQAQMDAQANALYQAKMAEYQRKLDEANALKQRQSQGDSLINMSDPRMSQSGPYRNIGQGYGQPTRERSLEELAYIQPERAKNISGALSVVNPRVDPFEFWTPEMKAQFAATQDPRAKQALYAATQAKLENSAAGRSQIINSVYPQGELTVGQQETDKKYAPEFLKWTQGGRYDAIKGISQLEEALSTLKSGKNVTGGAVNYLPKQMQPMANSLAVSTREKVEEVVQRNLRVILGAQFTEKEGVRLIERAYNDKLDEKENAKRVRRLINQIKKAAAAKDSAADYYNKNGTLQGWGGELPKLDDFKDAIGPVPKNSNIKTADEYLKSIGMP